MAPRRVDRAASHAPFPCIIRDVLSGSRPRALVAAGGLSTCMIGPTPPERELKYLVPRPAEPFATSFIRTSCRPDPDYPAAIVSSIYYDTAGWSSLYEKINSDYLKSKVRVRWYRSIDEPGPQGLVFLEAKIKVGSQRAKVRSPIALSAREVAGLPLDARLLGEIPQQLLRQGVPVPTSIAPVLLISFRRERYVESVTGARVAVDAQLAVEKVNPCRIPAGWPRALTTVVVEIKGREDSLPRSLAGLIRLGCRRESFCKYRAAYLAATRTTK